MRGYMSSGNKLNHASVHGGRYQVSKFIDALDKRKRKYRTFKPSEKAIEIATVLEERGWYKVPNCLDIEQIDKVAEIVELILDDPDNPYNSQGKSQEEARKSMLMNQVNHPEENVSEIHRLIFNDFMIDIAGAYIGCYPGLGTVNLRKSFLTELSEDGTQLFHSDPNSPKFLKFFIYFQDVDEKGGPLCYVEGSHKKKFPGWAVPYRQPNTTINDKYDEEDIKVLTANKGDLLIADTNGFHRGIRPINQERIMLTLDFLAHVEDFKIENRARIIKDDFDKLDDKHKPFCDFLNTV